jgi:hypothetical protein
MFWKKEEERWMDGWISSTTPEFAATIKAEKKSMFFTTVFLVFFGVNI